MGKVIVLLPIAPSCQVLFLSLRWLNVMVMTSGCMKQDITIMKLRAGFFRELVDIFVKDIKL